MKEIKFTRREFTDLFNTILESHIIEDNEDNNLDDKKFYQGALALLIKLAEKNGHEIDYVENMIKDTPAATDLYSRFLDEREEILNIKQRLFNQV